MKLKKTFPNGNFFVLAPHALLFKLLREFFEGRKFATSKRVCIGKRENFLLSVIIMGESPAGYKINYWHFCASLDLNKREGERALRMNRKRCFQMGLFELLFFDKYFLIILSGHLNPIKLFTQKHLLK